MINFYKTRSRNNLFKTLLTVLQLMALFSHLKIDMNDTVESYSFNLINIGFNFDMTRFFE